MTGRFKFSCGGCHFPDITGMFYRSPRAATEGISRREEAVPCLCPRDSEILAWRGDLVSMEPWFSGAASHGQVWTHS